MRPPALPRQAGEGQAPERSSAACGWGSTLTPLYGGSWQGGAPGSGLCLSPPLSLCFLGPRLPVMVLAQGRRSPPGPAPMAAPSPHCGGPACPVEGHLLPGPQRMAKLHSCRQHSPGPGPRDHFPIKARREGCTHPSRMPRRLAGRVGRGGGVPVAAHGPLSALRGGRAELGSVPPVVAFEAALGRGPTPAGAQPAWLPAPRGSDHSEGTRRVLHPQRAAESCCTGRALLAASRRPDSAPSPVNSNTLSVTGLPSQDKGCCLAPRRGCKGPGRGRPAREGKQLFTGQP